MSQAQRGGHTNEKIHSLHSSCLKSTIYSGILLLLSWITSSADKTRKRRINHVQWTMTRKTKNQLCTVDYEMQGLERILYRTGRNQIVNDEYRLSRDNIHDSSKAKRKTFIHTSGISLCHY